MRRGFLLATMLGMLVLTNPTASSAPGGSTDWRAEAEELVEGGKISVGVGVGPQKGDRVRDASAVESTGEGAAAETDGGVRRYWVNWFKTDLSTDEVTMYDACSGASQPHLLVAHDVETGEREVLAQECFGPTEDDASPTPTPPPPPTVDEIRDIAVENIDAPEVQTNPAPAHGGITGLENWFWYDGPGEVTAESSVRGYAVTATMRPTRFLWEPCAEFEATTDNDSGRALGCPAQLESSDPGRQPDGDDDAAAAAARWTYETEGRYVIRHHVVWEGEWTFSGSGQTESGTLSTIRTTGQRPYQVNEVRSRLTQGEPSR